MSNYPIKGFIERIKSVCKKVTGKHSGEKTPATPGKAKEGDGKVMTGRDELKEGVKKTA